MNPNVLIESKSMRESVIGRVDVLDKVKVLRMLPDDLHVSVQMVAEYYEVVRTTIEALIHDNREELESDGLKVLKGNELSCLKQKSVVGKNAPSFTIIPRRAILRIGMLLRDSVVAQRVRTYLLNMEQVSRVPDYNPSYMIEHRPSRARRWAEECEEKEAIEAKALMLEQRVAEYEPKISYLDRILGSKDTITVTQIAKDYGMSGQALNQVLHEEKVQYKQNGQWLLYREHQNKGLTRSETVAITRGNGGADTKMNTRWTQKGRLFVHTLLDRHGITALMDQEQAELA